MLMRRIVGLLEESEGKTRTRAELEAVLCPQGFRSDNVLRAIRTLTSMYKVGYVEGRFPETCRVSLPRPVEKPRTNEEVYALIAKLENK